MNDRWIISWTPALLLCWCGSIPSIHCYRDINNIHRDMMWALSLIMHRWLQQPSQAATINTVSCQQGGTWLRNHHEILREHKRPCTKPETPTEPESDPVSCDPQTRTTICVCTVSGAGTGAQAAHREVRIRAQENFLSDCNVYRVNICRNRRRYKRVQRSTWPNRTSASESHKQILVFTHGLRRK